MVTLGVCVFCIVHGLQRLHGVAYGFFFDEFEEGESACVDARAVLARYYERMKFGLGVMLLKDETFGQTQLQRRRKRIKLKPVCEIIS